MSKLLFSIVLILVLNSVSFCQQTNPSPINTKEDYLKKSKSQKTAAWIVLGAGVVLTSAGFAVELNNANDALIGLFSLQQPKSSDVGGVLFFSGLAAMAGSIPLFIASSKNKKRANAVSASFKMETRSTVQQGAIVRAAFPSLSIKLNL